MSTCGELADSGSWTSVGTRAIPAPHLAKWQNPVQGHQDSAITLLSTALCPQLLSGEAAVKFMQELLPVSNFFPNKFANGWKKSDLSNTRCLEISINPALLLL